MKMLVKTLIIEIILLEDSKNIVNHNSFFKRLPDLSRTIA